MQGDSSERKKTIQIQDVIFTISDKVNKRYLKDRGDSFIQQVHINTKYWALINIGCRINTRTGSLCHGLSILGGADRYKRITT